VPDEYGGSIQRRERALGRCDVVGERRRRVLNDGDFVAALAELGVNPSPARTVDEPPCTRTTFLIPIFLFSIGCLLRPKLPIGAGEQKF